MQVRRPIALTLALAGTLAFGACGGEGESDVEAPEINPLYAPGRLHTEAPDSFRVEMMTSEGQLTLFVKREWSPRGVDRFYTLVTNGYFDDQRIHRVVAGQVAQWGLHGDGLVNSAWYEEYIVDDDVVLSNERGTVAFAKGGANDRTTQVFVNLQDNTTLDTQGFSPFARVIDGMEAADRFYSEYGDGPPRGDGPYGLQALRDGNAYLDGNFPELTRLVEMRVIDFEQGGEG